MTETILHDQGCRRKWAVRVVRMVHWHQATGTGPVCPSLSATRQNGGMKKLHSSGLAISALFLSVATIAHTAEPPAKLQALVTPTSDNSAFPQLAEDGKGGVYMTWLETLKDGAGHRLRLAHRKKGGVWGEPSTVNRLVA